MLVVDRREGKSTDPLGANRAEIQAELEKHAFGHDNSKSAAPSDQIQVEQAVSARPVKPGVLCVHETPGPEGLVNLILQRVWGV